MAAADVNGRTDWASLLAEPGGPGGVYDRILRLARDKATRPLTGAIEIVIAGADEALAAVAALRGPADCRDFLIAVEPVVASLRRLLATFPTGINDRSLLGLLSLAAIGETVGSPLELPSLPIERLFTRFLVTKIFSREEKVTVALLSLGHERIDDTVFLFGKGAAPKVAAPDADPVALVKILTAAIKARSGLKDAGPAWEAFLRGFPSALQAEKVEWRHLVLAARIVLGNLGGTPMGEVAEALHRRIVALAQESA